MHDAGAALRGAPHISELAVGESVSHGSGLLRSVTIGHMQAAGLNQHA
jgi:hypothetical protein